VVYDMLQAFVDPQTLGLLAKFSATSGKVCTGAPLYGEHIRQVLHEYGFDDQQIDSFGRSSCSQRSRHCIGEHGLRMQMAGCKARSDWQRLLPKGASGLLS
jgi:hypothetical protein